MKKIAMILLAALIVCRGYSEPAVGVHVEGNPRPGGILFVSISNVQAGEKVDAVWGRAHLAFYDDKQGILRGFLPVPRDTKPGKYPLKINVTGESGTQSLTRVIEVSKWHFASQSIWLPKQEANNYNSPEVNNEYDMIDKALSTISHDRFPRLPLSRPVNAPLTTPFGVARYVNGKENGWHRGVDFGAGMGAPIYAPAAGRVVLAKRGLLLHGNVVVLDHGYGLCTLYIHMNSIKVHPGEWVERGKEIGTVGMTGSATGPNLHWGVYLYDFPVDPLLVFRSAPADWR